MKSIRKYLLKNDLYDNLKLSSKLLEHNSLLTPVLKKNFGDMTVDKCQLFQCMESPDTYLRESKLRQKCSNNIIVEATLRVMKKELPYRLIKDLQTTSLLFGDLLIKHKVKIRVSDQQILLHFDSKSGKLRMGRSHMMYRTSTNKAVCYVRELLVNEQELISSKNKYKKTIREYS
jgi:chorismate-pyruvate lyase